MEGAVDNLVAVHDYAGFLTALRRPSARPCETYRSTIPRPHPSRDGQRGIYTIGFTSHILDVEPEEQESSFRHLERQISESVGAVSGSLAARHVRDRQPAAQHAATNDFLPMHRRMERVTVVGDRPF